mgnify:CR=1 FL=1
MLFRSFPRNPAQADALEVMLAEFDGQVDVVPYIQVPRDELISRLSGRWTCRAEGHIFHATFNPPQVEGVCDHDGSELYQREDDKRETVERRISVYLEQTAPLIDYYRGKGKLVEIDGNQAIDAVTSDLLAAMPEQGD